MFAAAANFWRGGAQPTNTSTESYDRNNSAHQTLINNEIKAFQKTWEELRNSDITFASLGLGVYATRLYLLPYLILVPTFLFDVAFIVAVIACLSHAHNQPKMQEFKNQLTKLLDLYHWCEASNDSNITTDSNFLKLLQTIAPHVLNYADIKLTKNIDLKLISIKFADIMAQPPHQIPPELLIDSVRTKNIKKPDNSSWPRLFHAVSAQAKRILYNNSSSGENWSEWAAKQVDLIKRRLG
ncbi:MAG: hypothetical protein A3F11_10955 [Gammaproteobacteria bacterium RIFCSPHIGHO2_12_FULL_37_14]|nr:MAG: hypothetical protein A3F11_10955 [Gammaproteobacteria bacterium RIFCSPHIGHO2_12_FULL_37_14]